MKKILMIAALTIVGSAHAEVYKCLGPGNKIIYQERPCETRSVGQVNIKPFDPKKIAEAQEKLSESLKHAAEREASAAEAAQKERDLQTREELISEAQQRTDAINRNTETFENVYQSQP
ncbi:MAG: hypothetical protein ACU837_14920 [Gammaproteobacteria bacterium]